MSTNLSDLVHRPIGSAVDNPAIVSTDGELTYGEMWDRVFAVAELLQRSGVTPGNRVGLYLPRSADYIVSLLATLWIGATAVPLDPDYPATRIERMLAMTSPAVVLRSGVTTVAESAPWLELGEPWLVPHGEPAGYTSADHPALILFTSGSSGMPKGVVLGHAALANRITWAQDQYGFDETDRVLHKASTAFDAALPEIFSPLLAGGTVVVAPRGLQYDSLGLVHLMRDAGVTTAHFVPSLLRYVVAEEELAYCADLRRVFSGGEVLDQALMLRCQEVLPCPLFNQYGPTETAVNVSFWDCREPFEGTTVPIGRPIANVTCHVLDEHQRPLPAGVTGELWVGGVNVADGYLDDPTETDRRFRPDPFSGQGRLYRTGDLAQLTPQGYLEFHGRLDDQVKVRGVRVEPDEVATALREHPSIVDATVVADRSDSGEVRLHAYVEAGRRDLPVVDGHQRVLLPNGLAVAAGSPDEALFLYRKIFEEDEYARFGIRIPPDAVVVDVGANIGMFDLWVGSRAPNARIVAVEPNPDVLPYLRANHELYDLDSDVVPMAIADGPGTAELTSFPELTYLSGLGDRHPAAAALVRSNSELTNESMTSAERATLLRDTQDRLHARRHVVSTTDLSTVFRQFGLDRVDLLKVNVEGSELQALGSLDAAGWSRVAQVCVEVENSSTTGRQVAALLRDAGFEIHEIGDWMVSATGDVSYIYAMRQGYARATVPVIAGRRHEPPLSARSIREFLARRLPPAMHPARFVFLPELPRLPNGKIARAELPPPSTTHDVDSGGTDLAGRLREIWRQALGVDSIFDDDNFLALGGHSLIALRISAQVRETTRIDVRPAACLESLTFADWLADLVRPEVPATQRRAA